MDQATLNLIQEVREKLLSKKHQFDFWFEYSDDHRDWMRGCYEQQELFKKLMLIPAKEIGLIFNECFPSEDIKNKWIADFQIYLARRKRVTAE